MDVFCLMPSALCEVVLGTMSQQVSPERRSADAWQMESSPGTNQGDTPKKGRRKKGEKKPIPEMKLTVDIQQWLLKENGKALKMKLTDLMTDKTKEQAQIQSINYEDVAKKVAGYQALPPPGPLRVTTWEGSGMTRSVILHKGANISSPCCAVVHDMRCRLLTLRSEWATRDRDMQVDSEHVASRRPPIGGLAIILLC